jgi:hypothetical protein
VSVLNYRPPPTVEKFMFDDHLVRVIVGPIGSGKSFGCIMELLRRATLQAPAPDGVRYTRFALVRNTLQQLRQTVLNDVQQYLGDMVRYFVTDSTIQLRINLPDGTRVKSDWCLIPLDTKEDQRRLLSTQLTGAWVNECREVPFDIVSGVLERLGRYPSKLNGGATWFGLIADSNPWDTDSDYHKALVLEPNPKWKLFHQPSGIGPDAENLENLPAGYYENAASGASEERIATQIRSEFGASNAGQAVFRSTFHTPTHARDFTAGINPHRPLMVGLDLGRTPTALITQVDAFGRLLCFREICTEDMGLHKMLDEALMPVLMAPPFYGKRVFIVADPAGNQKSQLTEQTAFDVLKEHGFLAYPASTNDPDQRIRAVEKLLRTTIMGEPGIQIDRAGCPTLIHALGNKYRYRKKKDGQLEDRPEKLHPWSDIADALQYAAIGAQAGIVGRVLRRDMPRMAGGPKISASGWT